MRASALRSSRRHWTMACSALALALCSSWLSGCAHSPPAGVLRFRNQAPVWKVDDRAPFVGKPKEREYNRTLYHVDGFGVRRLTRAMDFPDRGRALDVNSLDEVPDSSWFTNRIGVRDLSIEELVRGANLDPSPIESLPWTIVSAKVGGTAIGFVFEDKKGDRYLLKFDVKSVPEMETAAHVLGHRILWAAGYNVPQDYLAYIRREDLVVSPKATKKDALGNKAPLTTKEVDEALAKVFQEHGKIRVLASRLLPGTPIGPYAREGKRDDDPNDLIAHERRRSVRGQLALFSWLGHTDLQEDNTLDVFRAEKETPDRGYVEHYLIDFGKAFGVMGYVNNWKTTGYTYRVDLGFAIKTIFGFGLWKRPWEDSEGPPLRGIAIFDAKTYDPSAFRANSQYWPLEDADRFDGFWGAKIGIRFTKEQLAAVVAEARYSDPRASAYMLETLIARQRKMAAYWFGEVSPLDGFVVESGVDPKAGAAGQARLCFDDLALRYALTAEATRYRVQAFDFAEAALGKELQVAGPAASSGSRTCVVAPVASQNDGYTIVELAALRAGKALPAVRVHVARQASGELAVIGLRRL
jgi:hypothetical protein